MAFEGFDIIVTKLILAGLVVDLCAVEISDKTTSESKVMDYVNKKSWQHLKLL